MTSEGAADVLRYGTGRGQWVVDAYTPAVLIAAAGCVAGGLIAAAAIRNPPRVPAPSFAERPVPDVSLHCAVDGPPLRLSLPEPAEGR